MSILHHKVRCVCRSILNAITPTFQSSKCEYLVAKMWLTETVQVTPVSFRGTHSPALDPRPPRRQASLSPPPQWTEVVSIQISLFYTISSTIRVSQILKFFLWLVCTTFCHDGTAVYALGESLFFISSFLCFGFAFDCL